MVQYMMFLDTIGTYFDLLELNETIKLYCQMIEKNRDEKKVYEILNKTRDSYLKEQDIILGNNQMNELKEEILSMWNEIFEVLLNNKQTLDVLYYSKIGKRRLPLYAIAQEIVKYDLSFFAIYRDLIQNNLYNPNLEYGVSDEPFFTLLPIKPINHFWHINQSVINNPQVDFHILRNGSDIIEWALYSLASSKRIIQKKYWEDYILTAIKGKCSLLDSRRYHGNAFYEIKPSIYLIMEHSNLKDIQDYVLSEEGINKQLDNSLYPSPERNKAIDFYLNQISNQTMQKRLIQLKSNL